MSKQDAAFEDLLHQAVHDLRGPVSQLAALSALLSHQHKGALNDEGQTLCSYIETAGKRAVTVLDALQSYAEVLACPAFETTDTNALVDSALYVLQLSIERTQAVVTRGIQ